MYDTIKLVSPALDADLIPYIEKKLIKKMAVKCDDGELLYCVTSGNLDGSYDRRISIRLVEGTLFGFTGGTIHLQAEASIHKLIFGNNVIHGINNIVEACRLFVSRLESILEVKLPVFLDWHVYRVDFARNYNLGSSDAVREFFTNYQLAYYTRRRCNKFGLNGLQFPGYSTSVKFYHKGPEFKKHDKSYIINKYGDSYYYWLKNIAMGILRVEIEVKRRKLKYDFNKDNVYVRDLSDYYFNDLFKKEINKILKESEEYKMEKVRNAEDVKRRLIKVYGDNKGRILLGTWFSLCSFGYEQTRDSMTKTTFYRHVKYLKDANVTWLDSNVSLKESRFIPSDFTLLDDKYVIDEKSFALVAC